MKSYSLLLYFSFLIVAFAGIINRPDNSKSKRANKLVAGLICFHDESSTYDNNFIESFKKSCEEQGLVENETYFIAKNTPETEKVYETANDLIKKGCNFIFADSFGFEDHIIKAAKENPTVHFFHATGVKAHGENLKNYHNVFATIHEGRYLTGVVAGLKLNEMISEGKITKEKAKMGYVGAYNYAEVISGYSSFYLGAKSVCDSVTMEVIFTNTWYDEKLEKEATKKLIDGGSVLISQHSDSLGAPLTCEEANVPNIAYSASNLKSAPKTYLVGTKIDWTPFFKEALNDVKNEKEIKTDITGSLSDGSVVLLEINDAIAAKDTKKTVDEVQEKLKSKEIAVFDINTFTVNGQKVTEFTVDLSSNPDDKFTMNAIKDGVFQESTFRSAPYFDLKIDGITILDEGNSKSPQGSNNSSPKRMSFSIMTFIISVILVLFL